MTALVSILLSMPLVGAYAIFGLGIVVIYQTSRVLNLAHGAQAMFCAYLYLSLTRMGVPPVGALVLGVAAGGVLGYAVERVFVRPLRSSSLTAQTVGTVAAFGLLVALASQIWGTGGDRAPSIFPEGAVNVGRSFITYGQLGLFGVMLVVSAALFAFLKFSDYGLAMRGTADNRRAASLMGIDPDIATSGAWVLGGATAGLAGILLGSATSLHPVVLSLQAIPAFVATLIGGMGSLVGTLVGAAVVGVAQGLSPVLPVTKNLAGGPQVILAIVAFVIMAMRGQTIVAGDVREAAIGGRAVPEARRARRKPVVLLILTIAVLAFPWLPFIPFSILGRANLAAQYSLVAVSLVVLTGWVGQVSLGQAAFVGVGAYVTGLAQGAWGIGFPLSIVPGAAAGALCAALLGGVALRVRGLYLAVATLIFSWTADVFLFQQEWLTRHSSIRLDPIGDPGALPYLDFTSRRTYYYVIWATVALVILMVANLRDRKVGRAFFAVRGSEMATASLGIDVVWTKLVAFAISGALAGIAGSFMLVGAQVVTVDQFNLSASLFFLAIAVVGGLTSLGGAVAAALLFAGLEEVFFRFPAIGDYLQLVTVGLLAIVLLAYPGGLAALGRMLSTRLARQGARVADLVVPWIQRLRRPATALVVDEESSEADSAAEQVTERDQEVDDEGRIATSAGRVATADPAGRAAEEEAGDPETSRLAATWVAIVARARQPFERIRIVRLARRQAATSFGADSFEEDPEGAGGAVDPDPLTPAGQGEDGAADAEERATQWESAVHETPEWLAPDRDERPVVVEAADITVRFGGLVAVNDATLTLRQGEIVGLIGPNGAGKTTLFNSIAGFVTPAEGKISVFGTDVTELPVYVRSRLGIARTFQVIQLFPQLTVFENLLVATYVADRSGLLGSMVVSGPSLLEERRMRDRVRVSIALLGLEEVADRPVAGLPFGVLRMVEIARALVTGAPVMMLDEPASGLDDRETERLSQLIRFIRSLGVTVLVIEHDVAMVTGVSDYMYVLDSGTLIAEGTPEEIKRNPAVIAAYLGEETTGDDDDEEAKPEPEAVGAKT